MQLDLMYKLFLDSRKRGTDGARKRCGAETIGIYQRNLKVFHEFMLSQTILEYQNMKRLHILMLVDWVQEKESRQVWAKATALQFWRSIKSFFRWVELDEECQADGLRSMKKYLPVISASPRKEYIPATTELRKFKAAFQTTTGYGFRDYVVFCTLIETGIRNGELCNLKVEDLLLDQRLMIVEGKSGRRPVPVTKALVLLMRSWIKRRGSVTMSKNSPYLFISKYRPKMTVNGVGQVFRKLRAKHGLGPISPHTLRHSFATYYLQGGGGMERLRNITGHSSYEVLKGYLHLAQVGGDGALDELEKVSVLKGL